MSRYFRSDAAGETFFMVNIYQCWPWLVDNRVRQALRNVIMDVRQCPLFRIRAWVLRWEWRCY